MLKQDVLPTQNEVLPTQKGSAKVNELVTSLVNSECLTCLKREKRLLTIGLLAQPERDILKSSVLKI